MKWVDRLKEKWGIASNWQFLIIMVVFACTGFTVVLIKKPAIAFLFPDGQPLWFKIGYWVMILPIYNTFLLFYGFVFGQFNFFWAYEKRMLSRFSRKKNDVPK
jgi:hypothetical protein